MRPKKLFIEALRWYLEDKCFEGASLILSGLYAERTDGSEPALQCLRIAGASDDLEAVLPELLPVLWDGGMHECMPRVIVSQEHYNYYGA